jgi:hypothetical protein
MNGYDFFLLSMVIAIVGVGLYNMLPLLDRLQTRLHADLAKLEGRSTTPPSPSDISRTDRHALQFVANAYSIAVEKQIRSALRPGETLSDFVNAAVHRCLAERRQEENVSAPRLQDRPSRQDEPPQAPRDREGT